jgi:hypothetical protein
MHIRSTFLVWGLVSAFISPIAFGQAATPAERAVLANYAEALAGLQSDVRWQLRQMPFGEKTIWTEYFDLVHGDAWSEIGLDNAAGNTLVHAPEWKLRNSLLDEYFTDRMVEIVLEPADRAALGAALDDNLLAKRLQVQGSSLYNLMTGYQRENELIQDSRARGLLAIERQKEREERASEEANMVITYQNKARAPRPQLDVTAISWGKGGPTAMVSDVLVREGDTIGPARVIRIGRYDIEFETDGHRQVVKLVDI